MPSQLRADSIIGDPAGDHARTLEPKKPTEGGDRDGGGIRDASAEQPRLDLDDAPDADLSFVRAYRDTIQIAPAAKRRIKARGIDAGHLKSFLIHFATYITRASTDRGQLCRRPADMVALMDYTRSRFYELISAARELGYLLYGPAGTRGVICYEVVHVPPLAAASSPARPDASPRAVRPARTLRRASSPARPDASRLPTTTDQDHHHHHQEELASRKQIRKACALDRAAGRTPDDACYGAMPRSELWDLIAELERQQVAPEPNIEEPNVKPAPEPPSADEMARRRNPGRELLDRIATREHLLNHHDPKVRAAVAAELETLQAELETLQAEEAEEEPAGRLEGGAC